MLCDFSDVIKSSNEISDSSSLCLKILNDTGFAMLPGSDFGFLNDKMIARISYTDFDGYNFMSKINSDTNINEDLIKKFAPNIVEGTLRIKDWVEKA